MKNENVVRIALFIVGFVVGSAGAHFHGFSTFTIWVIFPVLFLVSAMCLGYEYLRRIVKPRRTKNPHDTSRTTLCG